MSDPGTLASWTETQGRLDLGNALIDAWLRSAPLPPDAWRDPRSRLKTRTHTERKLAFVAWLARGELDIAAQHAAALFEAPESSSESATEFVQRCSKHLTGSERARFAALLDKAPVDEAARAARGALVQALASPSGPRPIRNPARTVVRSVRRLELAGF